MIGTVEGAYQAAPMRGSVEELRNKLVREAYTCVDVNLQGSQGKELSKPVKAC